MEYSLIFDCTECGCEIVVNGRGRGYEISCSSCGAAHETSVTIEHIDEGENSKNNI